MANSSFKTRAAASQTMAPCREQTIQADSSTVPMDSKSAPRLQQRNAWLSNSVRIHYIDCHPPFRSKGTILLLHGFPQTSYQFRHVIKPLSLGGYRVIAPDYRGAGLSSKPPHDFTKTRMAADLVELLHTNLGIDEAIHIVGHDIGGMVAHAYASRYPQHVASIAWGECPLPGTAYYQRRKWTPEKFHFVLHAAVPDLAEALIAGRERIYVQHFFDKLTLNTAAFAPADLDHYAAMYSQPGAMRCAIAVYAAFEIDAAENREWVEKRGKCEVSALSLSGCSSGHAEGAEEMVSEMYEDVAVAVVEDSGHYLAEENPEEFVRIVLDWVDVNSAAAGEDELPTATEGKEHSKGARVGKDDSHSEQGQQEVTA